jgi:superfamily II DNA or RNA helicase/predicted nucleic acid-binding protein
VTGLAYAFQQGGRWCWLCHRDELIQQAARTAQVLNPHASIGIIQADHYEPDAQLVIASVQSLRSERLASLSSFDGIIIDEAHHAVSASYRRILEALGAMRSDGPPVIGLTATVERADQVALSEVFHGIAYQYPLLQAISDGYLADIQTEAVALHVDFDTLPHSGDDYQISALNDAMLEAGVAEAVADAYVTHAEGLKTLVFTVSVEQAQRTADALNRRGVPAEWISGDIPTVQRRATIERLRTGETLALCNCAILTEGFDEPSLEALIMARPTQSKSLYLQMLGRGLRRFPSKDRCLVIDVAGVSRRHSLIQAPTLFGLPAEPTESVILAAESAATEQNRTSAVQRLLNASHGSASIPHKMHWITVAKNLFALSAGQAGTVLVVQREPGWIVIVAKRDREEALTSAPVDLELAIGIAEDFLRRANAIGLATLDAAWRGLPASDAQVRALHKWRIHTNARLTRGEATDLLTAAVAHSRAGRWAH